MLPRSFALPVLSAVAIVTTGCPSEDPEAPQVDPLVGDWTGTHMGQRVTKDDGTQYDYAMDLPYSQGGMTISSSLHLAEDHTGQLVVQQSTGANTFELLGEASAPGTWVLDTTLDGDPMFQLTCTADVAMDAAHCETEVMPGSGHTTVQIFDFTRAAP